MNEPTVLLAALDNGQHVQIGRVRDHAAAYDLFERMDSQISGFVRTPDERGRLIYAPATRKFHFINGQAVKFYRLRQQGHEFGNVPSYPVSAVRLTNRNTKGTMTSKSTPGGIVRPKKGALVSFDIARREAKYLNAKGLGRGHRAIKAQDGNYSVVFRPAVVNNKQRRVREVI